MRPSATTPVRAAEALAWLSGASPNGALEGLMLSGITHDSRTVLPGDLYVGLPGRHVHGADFAADAATAGAVAMLSDRPSDRLPTYVVDHPRAVLGELAAEVYGHPSQAVQVIGVTGTNGKTTTTFFVEAGLRAGGHRTAIVGTIETRVADRRLPSVRTTPEAPTLQALFALMREESVDAAAIEVSSHGLAQGRVDGTRFAAGVFTNLSHDHLDFHGDMGAYWAAKASLFEQGRCDVAVVDVDDRFGARLAQHASPPVVTTSSHGADATWKADEISADGWSMCFRLSGPGVDRRVRLRLGGRHNVDNALNAIAALHAVGVDADDAVDGVESLEVVPGRMERVCRGQPFEAVVDYAHNPDGLYHVLSALRELTPGSLTVVFGAPGDRDRAKRPLMGRITAAYADLVVVTDDDPWSEDPAAIRAAVLDGAKAIPGATVLCVPDRAEAIAVAVENARAGDTLLIAGRGHEIEQSYSDKAVAFDDRVVLGERIDAWMAARDAA